MELSFLYELVGYAGSILVAISLMMKSILRLRIISMAGAVLFITYGLLVGALPIVFLNGLILFINLYNLVRMLRQKDYFTLMEIRAESAYLKKFPDFYRNEILEFIPTYLFKPKSDQLVLFVLRNMVPAGVLIVKPEGEQAQVFLDFVIPGYRDFRAGKFLFEESAEFFSQKGIRRLVTAPGNARHVSYLRKMGFRLEGGMYVRAVSDGVLSDSAL